MKRNQKNLLGVAILIIFVSIYNYQTKYDSYDNNANERSDKDGDTCDDCSYGT